MSATNGPLKKRRITRACDRCHRGGIKCSAGSDPDVCEPCAAFGSECTYDRPMKRRGPPARSRGSDSDLGISTAGPSPRRSISNSHEGWTYHEIASHEQIDSLIKDYYTIVYPIFPYFHWPTFTSQIRQRLYTRNPAFHAVTMAVCAITSARIRAGACPTLYQPASSSSSSHLSTHHHPSSETFYHASIASFPTDITRATDFNYKRMKVILALLSVQYADIASANAHIGDYLTMCAIDGFHNESRWPAGLNEIEVQERRRLFWSAYQHDVYVATTWNGLIRQREAQSTVLYPAEVDDDDDIAPGGIRPPSHPHQSVSFFKGWNFVTDLYRILEHAVSELRARSQAIDRANPIATLFLRDTLSPGNGPGPNAVLRFVEDMYHALPEDFKTTKEMTGDLEKDRYGHQATNILVTLQTVKMVMAGMAEWSVEQRCTIAGELLDALATVPVSYIRASGALMIHHLAGVGHLLASIICSPISPSAYVHVRTVLLNMADLLATLEPQLGPAGAAPRIRDHVERIDRYMLSATEGTGQRGANANGKGSTALPPQAHSTFTFTADVPVLPAQASNIMPSSYTRTQPQTATRTPERHLGIPNGDYPATESETTTLPPFTADLDAGAGRVPDAYLIAPQDQLLFDSNQTQLQLPDDLFADWPFLFGDYSRVQDGAFDFLAPGGVGGQGLGMGIGLGPGQ
ncbi:hypothetical protein CI109_102600 [Kwoniella shandongensis]|uniref:Uncharacterized protein n=1 Tax=Kwoniella shandongensis TaxID=1734106 RepID=A0A5M6BX05_9TREE|nr:uncharacterized protein CI109_005181 [Kwoniella shandongensis]KAA5526412.1 hypothetical protein CI109_005181 [Kwoniella shandongensis]